MTLGQLRPNDIETIDKLFDDLAGEIKEVIPYQITREFIYKCLTQASIEDWTGIEKSSAFEESSKLIKQAAQTLIEAHNQETHFEIFMQFEMNFNNSADYKDALRESKSEIHELFKLTIIRLYILANGNLAYQIFIGLGSFKELFISLPNKKELTLKEVTNIFSNNMNTATLIHDYYFYDRTLSFMLTDLTLYFEPTIRDAFRVYTIKLASFYTKLFNKSKLQEYESFTRDRLDPLVSDLDVISRRLYYISKDKNTNTKYTKIMEMIINPKTKNLLYFYLLVIMKMAANPVMGIKIRRKCEDRMLLTTIKLFPTLFRE